jgi:hypothetical protein
MFKLFQSPADVHLKRVSALLRAAQLARAEHQTAFEHHGALARMYSERIAGLQAELPKHFRRRRRAGPNRMRRQLSKPR